MRKLQPAVDLTKLATNWMPPPARLPWDLILPEAAPPPEPEPPPPPPPPYKGARMAGLNESGPMWERYDILVRVRECRSERQPTTLLARLVGSGGQPTPQRGSVRESDPIRMVWEGGQVAGVLRGHFLVYGGIGEVSQLQLGVAQITRARAEVEQLFRTMDTDGSGALLSSCLPLRDTCAEASGIRCISGELETAEVGRLCESLCQRLLSGGELRRAMATMDPNGDGAVDFEEFYAWWCRMAGAAEGLFAPLFASGLWVEKAIVTLPPSAGDC